MLTGEGFEDSQPMGLEFLEGKEVGVYAMEALRKADKNAFNESEAVPLNDSTAGDELSAAEGPEQTEMYKEIQERLSLVPERNHLGHTRFMSRLQQEYMREEIEDKRYRLAQFEDTLALDVSKSKLDPRQKETLRERIEEYKKQIEWFQKQVHIYREKGAAVPDRLNR